MTKLGPPFKKPEDKKVARLFTFDRSVASKLDKLILKRKRSSFVNKSVKNGLKRVKPKNFGMDDEGNVVEL